MYSGPLLEGHGRFYGWLSIFPQTFLLFPHYQLVTNVESVVSIHIDLARPQIYDEFTKVTFVFCETIVAVGIYVMYMYDVSLLFSFAT